MDLRLLLLKLLKLRLMIQLCLLNLGMLLVVLGLMVRWLINWRPAGDFWVHPGDVAREPNLLLQLLQLLKLCLIRGLSLLLDLLQLELRQCWLLKWCIAKLLQLLCLLKPLQVEPLQLGMHLLNLQSIVGLEVGQAYL